MQVRPNPEQAGTGGLLVNGGDLSTRFGVSNYQENGEDNEARFTIRGSLLTFSSGEDLVNPSFGSLRAGNRLVLCLDFKLGTMLRDEFLNSVYVLSPILYQPGARQGRASIVLCQFTRRGKSGAENDQWQPGKMETLSLDYDSLAATVQDNRAPSFRRTVAVALLAQLHPDRACEPLRTRLSTINESCGEVRASAIATLGHLKDVGAVESLCKNVGDASQPNGIRRLSAMALGNFRDPKAVAALTGAVRDSDEHVSEAAISALGESGRDDALDALRRLLTDGQFARSAATAGALGHYGERAVAVLVQGVADHRVDVAAASATALGHLLTPPLSPHRDNAENDRVRDPFDLASDSKDPKAEKTQRLRDGTPAIQGDEGSAALDALEKALQSERTNVAEAAASALADVPGARAADILLRAVRSGGGPRVKIIEALANRGEGRAEDRLIALAAKGDQDVRTAAVKALGELDPESARPVLTAILADKAEPEALRRAAFNGLTKPGGGIPEATLLRVGAECRDPLRWSCLEKLAKLKSPQARDVVNLALAETDKENKWQRESLKRSVNEVRATPPAGLRPTD